MLIDAGRKKIPVSYEAARLRIVITGTSARVELSQLFSNRTISPIECNFSFPVPPNASVYRYDILNHRHILIELVLKPKLMANIS